MVFFFFEETNCPVNTNSSFAKNNTYFDLQTAPTNQEPQKKI